MFKRTRFFSTGSSTVVVLLLSFVLACAGGGDNDGSAGSASGSSKPATRFLSIGTAPPGGAFFVVGGALSEVLNAHGGDRGWQVTAEATKGTRENLRRLASGELDFGMANAAITYFAIRGKDGWDQPMAVQSVMTLAPNVALFIAPEDGGVKSINDLRGKRVVMGPAGAGFEFFLRPILAAHDLTYDDITPLNATQSGAVDLLGDGSAAAAFLGGAVPTASITQASSSQDITFVPFDSDAVDRLVADYPFFDRATIPAGTYRGQDEDFTGMNVGSMHLVTSASADDELVYQVTKSIYENRGEVVEKHPAGKAINPKVTVRDTGTPFHSGAVRFYREIGIWPEASADGSGNGGE